jgi:hypothetical protein
MNRKLIVTACSACLIGLLLSADIARADIGDQEILFTVKRSPIELPGRALTPGTYEMKFQGLERNIVEITIANSGRAIGFFEVLPVTRNRRRDGVKMIFSPAAGGTPARLEEFFYPATKTGYKFIYAHPIAPAVAP